MDKLFWIIPGRLAGRPGPDDEAWEVAALHRGGIGAVLSVNDGRMCDPAEFAAHDMAYRCLPLSDWVPPQPGDAELCLSVLPQAYSFVTSQLEEGRNVLVHCSGGNDRAGLFLSYFLMRHNGLLVDDAIQTIRKQRPTALGAEGWEAFAREILYHIE
jgi:protein-tyrosine phosphatase